MNTYFYIYTYTSNYIIVQLYKYLYLGILTLIRVDILCILSIFTIIEII